MVGGGASRRRAGMRAAKNEEENGTDATADPQMTARICWHYFKEGQTQEAIALRLGLTRKRVNRILNDARTSGFVQITINDPIGACGALEAGGAEAVGPRRG